MEYVDKLDRGVPVVRYSCTVIAMQPLISSQGAPEKNPGTPRVVTRCPMVSAHIGWRQRSRYHCQRFLGSDQSIQKNVMVRPLRRSKVVHLGLGRRENPRTSDKTVTKSRYQQFRKGSESRRSSGLFGGRQKQKRPPLKR